MSATMASVYLLSITAFCLPALAAVVPRGEPCSFVLTAVGVPNGGIIEGAAGENEIGSAGPQGHYYFSVAEGILYDSLNHNCRVSPSTAQFQCTTSTAGSNNFTVSNDNSLLHGGDDEWLACPATGTGLDGSYNIFSTAKANTTACETVTLRVGGYNCTALGQPSLSSATTGGASTTSQTQSPTKSGSNTQLSERSSDSPASSSSPTTPTSISTCPTDLSSGIFQYPRLIVPTSPNDPDHAFGSGSNAYISPINTTLFNFDIPSGAPYDGDIALLFLFPFGEATYYSGIEEEEGEHGGLIFAKLAKVATSGTTYNTKGDVATNYGSVEVLPGNNYTVATADCESGSTVTYLVSSSNGVELDFSQPDSSSAIGLYIVPCSSS